MKLKRLCVLLLAVILMVGLCACGKDEPTEKTESITRPTSYYKSAHPVGSFMRFGTYQQTEDGTDDIPIEWIVLENDGETALLISLYALDCKPYNTEFGSTTWEHSTLRAWLNEDFYNRAFNAEQKKAIQKSNVSADRNPDYDTDPGNSTEDNVFLPSINEISQYLPMESARKCEPTDYASQQGIIFKDIYGYCSWRLRSPGHDSYRAAYIYNDGSDENYGYDVYDDLAIRPCIRVRLADVPENVQTNTAQSKKLDNISAQPGNYVTFGNYSQTETGKDSTPIEWLVLESDGKTALLISRYALDCKPYNTENVDTSWDACTLRTWLNKDFYNSAFSSKEKKLIITSDISDDRRPAYGRYYGNATKDNLFLLSLDETKNYFTYKYARECIPTAYAIQKGVSTGRYKTCRWWLRSPGNFSDSAITVEEDGFVSSTDVTNGGSAVRPCVRVQLPEASKKDRRAYDKKYDEAVSKRKSGDFDAAIAIFTELGNYSDASAQIGETLNAKAYAAAVALMTDKNYEDAILAFEELNGFGDSEKKIDECKTGIFELEYQNAIELMNGKEYEQALWIFESLASNGYKDSEAKINECETKIFELDYQEAVKLMTAEQFEAAIKAFEELNGYGDSAVKITECENAISEQAYQKAIKLMADEKFEEAIEAFKKLNGYSDSEAKISECETAIFEREYQKAAKLMNDGNYEEALAAFDTLSSYKDGTALTSECVYQKAEELRRNGQYEDAYTLYETIMEYKDVVSIIEKDTNIASIAHSAKFKVGKYITFGSYPQMEMSADEPIEWLVLENDGETVLLISRYALDCLPYNTDQEDTTWERCTLRAWLNNDFYDCAFDTKEKQLILTSDVPADKNPKHDTNPGNATKDKVFILSIVEAEKYFVTADSRMCAHTDYAIQNGAWARSYEIAGNRWACLWWLRSTGATSDCATNVYDNGNINTYGYPVNIDDQAVRPCVRIRLF